MRTSESISKLAPALIKVQGAIKGAEKGSENPFFHSRYADLESCWKAARDPLQENGLAVTQLVGEYDSSGAMRLETVLLHESGEWISSIASIPLAKKDPHGAGSGITYLRRYGLASILGLLQVDDDANAAVNEKTVIKKAKLTPAPDPMLMLSEGGQEDAKKTGREIVNLCKEGVLGEAYEALYCEGFTNEYIEAVWSLLKKVRGICAALDRERQVRALRDVPQ